MTRRITLLIAAAALLIPLVAGAAPMKAGKWQLTMEMDMPGMPMKMPPMSFSKCVTKEEAENPQPPKSKQSADCKVSDYKLDGNTLTWNVTCEKENLSGTGKITYSSESYEGTMQMKMGEQEMSAKYSGKRLGDCDASEK